jgi:glycosyltransferase involved in cell wall biosynthesis
MKGICFYISCISNAGGTERVCCEIATKLAAVGYDVSIMSMYGNTPYFNLHSSISVKSVFSGKPKTRLVIPLSVYKVRSIISVLKPDILVSVDTALFSYAYIATLSMGITHVAWEHFHFNVSLGASIRVFSRRLAAKYSKAVITLTNQDALYWQGRLKCKSKVLSIPNPSPFSPLTLDVSQRKAIVLSVGRLTHQKGFDRLLHGWARIADRIEKGWELHIVGSGELKGNLQDLINSLHLGHSVKMIAGTPEIQKHYKEASIYCMTSRFEGFPMVLIEAQSFGLPIISYDCQTGPSEIISPYNGVLVPDGNEDVFAQSLLNLILNKSDRLAMGQHAFNNSSRFHINKIIDQWICLLERL